MSVVGNFVEGNNNRGIVKCTLCKRGYEKLYSDEQAYGCACYPGKDSISGAYGSIILDGTRARYNGPKPDIFIEDAVICDYCLYGYIQKGTVIDSDEGYSELVTKIRICIREEMVKDLIDRDDIIHGDNRTLDIVARGEDVVFVDPRTDVRTLATAHPISKYFRDFPVTEGDITDIFNTLVIWGLYYPANDYYGWGDGTKHISGAFLFEDRVYYFTRDDRISLLDDHITDPNPNNPLEKEVDFRLTLLGISPEELTDPNIVFSVTDMYKIPETMDRFLRTYPFWDHYDRIRETLTHL